MYYFLCIFLSQNLILNLCTFGQKYINTSYSSKQNVKEREVIEQKFHSDVHEYKARIHFKSTIDEVKTFIIFQLQRPRK